MSANPEKTIRNIYNRLLNAMTNRFYGSFTINFEGGKITMVEEKKMLKPGKDI